MLSTGPGIVHLHRASKIITKTIVSIRFISVKYRSCGVSYSTGIISRTSYVYCFYSSIYSKHCCGSYTDTYTIGCLYHKLSCFCRAKNTGSTIPNKGIVVVCLCIISSSKATGSSCKILYSSGDNAIFSRRCIASPTTDKRSCVCYGIIPSPTNKGIISFLCMIRFSSTYKRPGSCCNVKIPVDNRGHISHRLILASITDKSPPTNPFSSGIL